MVAEVHRVSCEFCRQQIQFRKAAMERIDFKVKKEAACSQLQMDGLQLKSILTVSDEWLFMSLQHPHVIMGGVQTNSVRRLCCMQSLSSHILGVESVISGQYL